MYPYPVLTIGGKGINLYIIFLACGICVATAAGAWLAYKRGISVPHFLVGAALAVFAGLQGVAVMGGWVQQLVERLLHLPQLSHWGNTTVTGGILFYVVAVLIYCDLNPVMAKKKGSLDPFFVAPPLGQAIGRLGCFSAGCCHGKPAWGVPWAVTFKPESACIYKGIPVHPTQLYESVGDLALFALFVWLYFREPRLEGKFLWVYFVGYGSLRFLIEFFRGDPRPFIGPLSFYQWLCLAMVLSGVTVLGLTLRRGEHPVGEERESHPAY